MAISREIEWEDVTLTTSSATTASIECGTFSGIRLHFPTGADPGTMTVYDLNPSDAVWSDTGQTIAAPGTLPGSVVVSTDAFAATAIAIVTTNDISNATVTVVKKR